jgi:hypothetical protein
MQQNLQYVKLKARFFLHLIIHHIIGKYGGLDVQLDGSIYLSSRWGKWSPLCSSWFSPKAPGIHRVRHCGGPHTVWMLWKTEKSLGLP